MVGANVIAADSDREARRLATTQQMSFADLFRGARGLSRPPIDDIESYWSPLEKAQAMQMLARSVVGSPETVRAGIQAFMKETGADALMVVSDVYENTARLRSFELIHEAVGWYPRNGEPGRKRGPGGPEARPGGTRWGRKVVTGW